VSSLIAFYLCVNAVRVIAESRHFSATAWGIVACITIAAAWVAVRAWREVRANRR
jgi:hypothetical protein